MFRRLLFTVFVLALIGCAEDKRSVVVEPEPPPNQPPIIDVLIVPNQVDAIATVIFQVIARDPDNDRLSIVWGASEGTTYGDSWIAPNRSTEVVISVHVSDGKNLPVSQTKTITVIKKPITLPPVLPPVVPPPLPPPVQVQPEPPPREPEVAGAWNIIGRVGIEHVAPGQEKLKVSIGDTIAQVNALAIHAEWIGDDNQTLANRRLGAFHCFYEDGKVIGITVVDDRYKTPEGIGAGMHIDDAVAKYGEPDTIERGVQFTFYNYFRSGYIFGFDATKRIVLITVRG